jgi:hypothetical protein
MRVSLLCAEQDVLYRPTVVRCIVVVVAKMLPRMVKGLDVLEASISPCHIVALS